MPFLNRIGSGSTSKFGFRMGFVPGAPTSVTASLPATYGNTTASVSWTAPVMLGSPALNDYVIQYSSDSGSTFTTFSDSVSTSTSVTVTGLTNGTAYVFRVAAVNTIGTGAFSGNSNSVTPLFGKIATPVVSNIAETTSTIPLCYDNYASQNQDDGYVYNYYDYNFVPNDQSGACHGWTGLAENVNRYTYVYLSKTGWANSDSIYLTESTNSTPATTETPTTTAAPACDAYGTYIGPVCVGYDLYDRYADGACGTYDIGPIESNSVEGCGYVPPATTAAPGCVCCVGTSVSEYRCIYPPQGATQQQRNGVSYDGSCGASGSSGTGCSGACSGCSCPALTNWGSWYNISSPGGGCF